MSVTVNKPKPKPMPMKIAPKPLPKPDTTVTTEDDAPEGSGGIVVGHDFANAEKEKPVQLTAKAKPVPVKTGQVKTNKAPKEYTTTSGEALEDEPSLDPTPEAEPVKEPVHLTAKQGHASVSTKFKDGSEVNEELPVGALVSSTTPLASVTVSMAVTRNLGNYESVKMMVSLTLPCPSTETDLDEAFAEAKGWVDTRVELLNQEINEQIAAA